MKSKYTFRSPSLQKIDAEADIVISNHIESLNHASNDIKALEEKLESSAIPFTFIYLLSQEERRHEQEVSNEHSTYLCKFIEYTERSLVWGKTGDSDKFRFCYNVYVTNQEIDEYYTDNGLHERMGKQGATTLVYSKPLIESKSYIRLSVEKELPFFYRKIIEELSLKNNKEQVFGYSPRYNIFDMDSKINPKLPF